MTINQQNTLFQKHLQQLKNYKSPDLHEGKNKLYFLEVEEKPGKIKPGDTHRDVEERNKETMTNASLHRKKGTKPFYVIAEKWDGSEFRDYEYHLFLKNKGFKFELNDQGRESEFVESDPLGNPPALEQLLKELEEFTRKPVRKQVQLRTAQNYLLEQQQKAIDEGHQYINAGYCVRVGKTIISLTLSATNNWIPVYIGKNLTSQSSAKTDNEEYGIVQEMLTQSLHGVDELEDGELSKRTKAIIDNIEKVNTDNKPVIFFVDEVDDASHTKKSRSIITPVVEYFKANGKFACIITMSGTRIYRGEKILKELTDGDIKELSLEYYEMQILQPETTCRREFRYISFYSEADNGLTNISDAMKNKDHGHKSLATFLAKLLGTNNFEFKVDPNFPHWFFKFATVGKDNAKSLVVYLNRNFRLIENKEFHFAEINGDVTNSRQAQDYCKRIIKEQQGRTCVFISQGMATTSFSVGSIGNSAVFSDNEITADDVQALHRSATWETGKTYCNMINVTTNGSKSFTFDDIFEDETKIAKTREEKIEIYRELITNNSIIHFTVDGDAVSPVKITHENADKVIDQKTKSMTRIGSIMGIINDLDEEIKNNILLSVDGNRGTSLKSSSTKGNKFDPFDDKGDGDEDKKKKSTGLGTPKQKEKIFRAFVEASVNVPALAREQQTTIQNFNYWTEVGVSKELFFEVYNSSSLFKDRIDSVYNLCDDDTYLVENYINKITT